MKEFLNYKKPYLWVSLVIILVAAAAAGVYFWNKEQKEEETVTPPEQITVTPEEEEPEPEPEKSALERFSTMDWSEVTANAKTFGEEGWENGIVLLAELPEANIRMYGYNDEKSQYEGVAIDHDGNVNYFDWLYTSAQHIQPQMYWDAAQKQLQVTLNVYDGSGVNAEELHVLLEYDTMTLEDFVYRSSDYLKEVEEQLAGTGLSVGSYADIVLGDQIFLQFEPVKTVDGVEEKQKLHQATISLNPTKDGYLFELGEIGLEPEKRAASIKLEGSEESFTEVQYISKDGFSIWYPEMILEPYKLHNQEGFVIPKAGDDSNVKVTIVPEGEMTLNDSYLKKLASNYKSSGEYQKVTVSKIRKLTSDSKDISIRMIEVVHDDTAERFYTVKGKNSHLFVTVSMPKEALEGMGARVNQMLGTLTFIEQE